MIKKTFQTIGIRLIGTAATFALSVFVARGLGPDGAGYFFYGLAVMVGAATLGRLGLTEVAVRFVSANTGPDNAAGAYAVTALAIVAILSIAVALFVWILGPVVMTYFNPNGAAFGLAIAQLAYAIPAVAMTVVLCGVLQGYRRPVTASFLETGFVPLLVLLGAITLKTDNLSSFIGLYVGASMLGLICATVLAMRQAGPGAMLSANKARELVHAGHPLLSVNMMGYIIRFAPLLCLGIFATPSDTGVYAIVIRLGLIFGIILQSLNNVLRPAFAVAHQTGALVDLQRQIQSGGLFLLAIGLPLIAGTMFFRQPILLLFGPEFVGGGLALVILLLGQTVNLITASSGAILAMTGNERTLRTYTFITALLCILLSVALIPPFGLIGAASATALTIALQGLLAAGGVYRKVGVWPFVSFQSIQH
ncbi:Membrane protein involved in the export of O-antigen and teichoic acid [Cognatiyoonia koreensis]|uniref:Membrane protein involved in the export of O-antigen and teichoic acid n=1 Tax=Cognatiyoonia koreensis TaxID=364200 RepID=A0A1I0RLS8_9RHOB|nr:oligosaccharide flippase family protein [Cognatiyoonia koreensis]SEW42030.1 Membrane protein involved in the export of O-antigen and teichoic acid [Cognatiyoonia koreensis]